MVAILGSPDARRARDDHRVFARVIEVQGELGRIDDAIAFLRAEVIPQACEMQGFRGGQWLVDRASGRLVGMALWETEHDVEASAEAMRRFRETGAGLLGGEVVSVRVFEVIAEAKPSGI